LQLQRLWSNIASRRGVHGTNCRPAAPRNGAGGARGSHECGRVARRQPGPPGAHHRRRPFHAVAPHQPRPGLDEGTKEYEAALLWIRLFRSLDAIVGGQDASARAWLSSPNLAFAGQRPRDLIVGTEGLVRVVQYLDAHRAKL